MLALLTLLLAVPSAHAIENVKGPFTLTCSGGAGSLRYEQTSEGIAYQIDLPTKHFQGFVKHYAETSSQWEQGDAAVIDPVYDQGKLWLDVTAIHGHKAWSPPHDGCLPSRAPNPPCYKIHVPGSYANIADEWLNVMVDVSEKGNPKFMHMDLGESHFYDLGANPRCELSGL